ncbi:MAG: response regulator [Anaerolineales bacterium]|nr:response regulator [Anaerolineales bacterium]
MKIKKILLVEDNPSDIGLTRRALEKSHVANDLVVVEDGQEALDYLFGASQSAGPQVTELPALILLDLKLPKVDGLEVLRRIRSDPNLYRLPVVVLTTSTEEQDIVQSYHLGANSYIRKPVDFTQFVEAIQHLGLYWLLLNEPAPRVTQGS